MTEPLPEDNAVRRLHAEYATVRALAAAGSLAEAAPRILEAVCDTFGWAYGGLWRVDPRGGVLRCVETWHSSPGLAEELSGQAHRTTFEPSRGLPGRVWSTNEPVWIRDVGRESDFPCREVAEKAGLHTALGVPVRFRDRFLGILEFFGAAIPEPDIGLLEMLNTIASQIGQFVEHKRTEEELATLFRMSRDMLCIADFEGHLLRVNPAWAKTLGYTEDEITSRPYMDLVHPDDRDATIGEEKGLTGGAPTLLFENRYRCKDGSYRWMSWNATPDNERGLIYCTVRDVTEQKRVDAELKKARDDARAASRAKSDFLANMSHEIRTPMNAVIGMTELLQDTPLSADQREYTDTLQDAAESLLGVISDILDFSKIEAGMFELSPAAFDLREALENTLRTLGVRAHEKGIELVCEVGPEVPDALVGDAPRLRQVILNLVGNAIKFTGHGEVLLQVETADATDTETTLRFLVADTGIGIPRDKQDLIFEAFAQADGSTTREYGGTGLGLTIAASLVRMMGGEVSVDSAPGRGSRFVFTARFGLPPPSASPPPEKTPQNLRGLRVLVVDDNATNRRILTEMLKRWEMEPRAASGGKEALRELERAQEAGSPYSLVLLDGNMPGMDGFTVAERIRERGPLAGASIMMLTSSARPGDRARCLELGVASYISKPIRRSDLLETITDVLARRPGKRIRRPRAVTPPAGNARRLRVLVAEDNAVNQQVVLGFLARAGHAAVVVSTGHEVLGALERHDFDLILMDLQMPGLDGLETTAAIRQRERTSGLHVPIVALTAHVVKGDAERCLAAGMDGYVAKPLRPKELFAAIESALDPARRVSVARPRDMIFDEALLLERVGGDRAALAQLVEIFLADAPSRLADLRRAVDEKDAPALRAAAHTLKGAVSNFAAPAATEAAARVLRIAEGGRIEEGRSACDVLEREIDHLSAALAERVEKPAKE